MNKDLISTEAIYDPYLSHSGIKGMKWGIRRYQNPDGTLTPEGMRRYGYNLDLTNRSRQNIAKIRYGEARRRYEYAKMNKPENRYRLAELRRRQRSAKAAVRESKQYDKGSELAAKGRTITGAHARSWAAAGAAVVGSMAIQKALNRRIEKIAPGDDRYKMVANALTVAGSYALAGGALAYATKQAYNQANLRAYYNGRVSGRDTIKRIGSQEYTDRISKNRYSN